MGSSEEGASLDALQRIYEERLSELRRVAAGVVVDRDLACDVVQDAFVRAVRQRRTFSGRGSLEGWVWRIVINTARDARAGTRPVIALDEIADPGSGSAADGAGERVREAVERLPERQRLVLFLRVYADLDYRAIADAVGISEGTVGATLNAAHTRLRKLLAEVPR